MTNVEASINLISDFYAKHYGNIDDLKEKYINHFWLSSKIKKEGLIDRFQSDYDFLADVPENLCINPDDDLLGNLNEYRYFFKHATILLSNDVYRSDFINPFTEKQATPHDIVEAKMFLFDASSPKEAVEKMNSLWKREKSQGEKDNDNKEIDLKIEDIKNQIDDNTEALAVLDDDLEYLNAFCDLTMKLGKLAIVSIEEYRDKMKKDTIRED